MRAEVTVFWTRKPKNLRMQSWFVFTNIFRGLLGHDRHRPREGENMGLRTELSEARYKVARYASTFVRARKMQRKRLAEKKLIKAVAEVDRLERLRQTAISRFPF